MEGEETVGRKAASQPLHFKQQLIEGQIAGMDSEGTKQKMLIISRPECVCTVWKIWVTCLASGLAKTTKCINDLHFYTRQFVNPLLVLILFFNEAFYRI